MSNITQVTTFFYPVHGGVEQQVLEISLELIKQGHKVTVICSDSTRTKKRVEESDSKYKNIKIKRCKTWFGFSQFYKIYPQLFFELMRSDFDVIHVHGFRKFEIYPSLLAAKLKRKKIVLTTHNPFYTSSRRKLLQLFVNLHDATFGRLFTKYIDKVICLTEEEIPIVEKFNVDRDKITVIPDGVSAEIFTKGDSKEFIETYGIPYKRFENTVIWVGRLNKVKALNNLRTAVNQLKNTLFLFIGPDDNSSKEYKNIYRENDNVLFTGPVKHNQIRNALNFGDIFVLPSLHEAFGVVLIEAMAQGKPIISTNVGGPNEIIKDRFGILQDPNDEWAWMLNIKKLLNNKKLRKSMGEEAKKEALKYKWENIIDMIVSTYGIK